MSNIISIYVHPLYYPYNTKTSADQIGAKLVEFNLINPVIFRENQVVLRTNLVIFRNNSVIFRTKPVILMTNPVIYMTNPVIIKKIQSY